VGYLWCSFLVSWVFGNNTFFPKRKKVFLQFFSSFLLPERLSRYASGTESEDLHVDNITEPQEQINTNYFPSDIDDLEIIP
jgi:hypothetical protein